MTAAAIILFSAGCAAAILTIALLIVALRRRHGDADHSEPPLAGETEADQRLITRIQNRNDIFMI